MKQSKEKTFRIVAAVGIHLVTFLTVYVYFRYLYRNGGILSVSHASQYLMAIIRQSFVANAVILLVLLISFIKFGKRTVEYFSLTIEKRVSKGIVIALAILYVLSLIRQLVVYEDSVTILFRWVYYLFFVAFCEELEYRAVIPAVLKGHVSKKVEWLLPNILFACAHSLMPMVQGKDIVELLGIILSQLAGYTLMGVFWEWCKRKGKSLWIGVLMHAILDFGI